MTDEKILAVYQQVRSRYTLFDYHIAIKRDYKTLDVNERYAKAAKELERDFAVAFAKEIVLWWENES